MKVKKVKKLTEVQKLKQEVSHFSSKLADEKTKYQSLLTGYTDYKNTLDSIYNLLKLADNDNYNRRFDPKDVVISKIAELQSFQREYQGSVNIGMNISQNTIETLTEIIRWQINPITALPQVKHDIQTFDGRASDPYGGKPMSR